MVTVPVEVVKERSGCAKSARQRDSRTAGQSDGLSGTQIFCSGRFLSLCLQVY